jgi:hypothetical protein
MQLCAANGLIIVRLPWEASPSQARPTLQSVRLSKRPVVPFVAMAHGRPGGYELYNSLSCINSQYTESRNVS